MGLSEILSAAVVLAGRYYAPRTGEPSVVLPVENPQPSRVCEPAVCPQAPEPQYGYDASWLLVAGLGGTLAGLAGSTCARRSSGSSVPANVEAVPAIRAPRGNNSLSHLAARASDL